MLFVRVCVYVSVFGVQFNRKKKMKKGSLDRKTAETVLLRQ